MNEPMAMEYDPALAQESIERLTAALTADRKSPDINATLEERGQRYGKFKDHAYISQSLKRVMKDQESWIRLDADQQEALEMIAHKIARILNGDPNYDDSWHDIAGYATLVAERLRGNAK